MSHPAAVETWRELAACRDHDPGLFFPDRYNNYGGLDHRSLPTPAVRDAKRVCGGCPVRSDCLTYALTNDEDTGIWGGLTPEERRR